MDKLENEVGLMDDDRKAVIYGTISGLFKDLEEAKNRIKELEDEIERRLSDDN